MIQEGVRAGVINKLELGVCAALGKCLRAISPDDVFTPFPDEGEEEYNVDMDPWTWS